MYKVSSEQMKAITETIGQSLEVQTVVFEAMDLNPYEFYENHDPADYFNIVLSVEELEDQIKYLQEYPEEWVRTGDEGVRSDGFSEDRIKEIESGSKITPKEAEEIRESYIQEKRYEECPVTWTITEITDNITTVYAFYFEQMWGQGGLHINDFWGFFATVEDADKALQEMDLIEV